MYIIPKVIYDRMKDLPVYIENPMCLCTHRLTEHNEERKCEICKCDEFNRADYVDFIDEE